MLHLFLKWHWIFTINDELRVTNYSHKTGPFFSPVASICHHTSLNVAPLLHGIFQRNVQIDFENQQRYDGLLCSMSFTQNSSLGVHQAKMTWWGSRIIHNADSQPIIAKPQNNEIKNALQEISWRALFHCMNMAWKLLEFKKVLIAIFSWDNLVEC